MRVAAAARAAPRPVSTPPYVVTLGESLFDASPAGLFLGGAPLNVAVHLTQFGVRAALCTRVGRDDLGDEVALRLREKGVDTSLLQQDDNLPTGFVRVTFSGSEPSYDIRQPSAWDNIQKEPSLMEAAAAADALVFGSLAQRCAASRDAIAAAASASQRAVFDINLRQPHVNLEAVKAAAPLSWLLKLNEDEAGLLVASCGLKDVGAGSPPASLAAAIGAHFGVGVALTLGGAGGVLRLPDGATWRHGGCKVTPVDAVGAGDSFLAALLHGLLTTPGDPGRALATANAVGAFVATQRGATPRIDAAAVEALRGGAAPAERVD